MFKKFFTTFLMAATMAVTIPALTGTASAQKHGNDRNNNNRNYDRYNDPRYNSQYDDRYYDENYNDGYYDQEYKRPNVYDRHRKAVNLTVATGAGAVIGAIFGGKKGALIGAAAGAVTGAVITAKQKPRNTERYPYQY